MKIALLLAGLALTARAEPVSFRAEIAPLLHRRCATCHSEDNPKGKYRLDSFAKMQHAGESDLAPLIAGKPQESELARLLVEPDAHDRMPQKADALPAVEIALIERWITEGARFDGESPDQPLVELARASLLRAAPEHYPRPAPISALAFSPDGTQLAVSGYYEVTVWDIATGDLTRRIGGLPERITALAWSRRGLAVAGGSPAQWGTVALVDPAQNFAVRLLCDLPECALSVAFNRDGTQLAAGCGDRTIRFFDPASGKTTRILRTHADWVQSVAFNHDGTLLVSASRDRTARVFATATGEVTATYTGHDAPVFGAVFSGSGSSVVSFGPGRTLHVWDARDGERRSEIDASGSPVQTLAVSHWGLFVGGADHLVRVQSPTGGAPLFTLHGQRDAISAFAIAGDAFASGAADGEVCVWSLACGTWTHRFTASPR